jgi:ABC-2 type transport system permease protein
VTRPLSAATALTDLRRLVGRALRHDVRTIDALLVNLALPAGIMLLFVYVFGGAITTGSSGLAYVDFVVPAVLLMAGGYGAALVAVNVAEEMTSGMIDRFRTLPISAWTVPAGHVVASLVRNVAATAIALAVALVLGFRPTATLAEWALVLALVTGYILAVSCLAMVWGLLVTSTQAASAFSFLVIFFPYLSDGVVPAETMPPLLRGFAEHQPATPMVATLRALLLDQPMGDAARLSAAWLVGAVAISLPLAGVLFRRRTAA